MKKLFLLLALVATTMTALPNETFYVIDDQGMYILYEKLTTDGEVSYLGPRHNEQPWPVSMTVPATVTYEGTEYKVTEIGDAALAYSELTSVTLSDGLKTISTRAFKGASITELIIPETVDSIGGGGFGNGAFYQCQKLEKIQLPKALRSIAMFVFGDCSALTEIAIPEDVIFIGGSAFSGCSSLKSIEIPDAVTFIGDCAFYNCSSLESVKLPAEIEELGTLGYWTYGTGVFQGCYSLKNITLPKGLKTIPYGCFSGCTSLTSVLFPSELKEIGCSAFDGCTALEIEIPETVERIGGQAFWNTQMKNVNLPKSLCEINGNSFGDALENLYIDAANPYYTAIEGVLYNKDVTELIIYPLSHGDSYTIPATITTIDVATLSNVPHISVAPGSMSFSCADGVLYDKDQTTLLLYTTDAPKSFVIPATVKTIGANALKDKQVESVALNEGLEKIYEYAFYGTSISDVIFPSTILEIGDGAFYNCKLTEVNIPSSIDRIGRSAFGNNPDLTTVTIGEPETRQATHTIIDNSAFSFCENIETVILGSCVKEVRWSAFYMSSPAKIELNEGLERIEGNAFGKYDEYKYPSKDFILPSTLTYLGGTAFMNIKFPRVTCCAVTPPELGGYKPIYGVTLYVYDVAEQDYKHTDWAALFTNIKTMEYTGIEDIDADMKSPSAQDIYYDLTGRRVTNPANGLYIKNGKKVYISR